MLTCPVLSYFTLCCIAGVVCTFSSIGSVGYLSSLLLSALHNTSCTGIAVATIVAELIEPVFDIPFSSIVTVTGKVLTVLNGTSFGDINLLYELIAKCFVAGAGIGARSMYKYCPAYNCFVAV